MIRRLLKWSIAALALLAAVLAVNTWRQSSRQTAVGPAPPLAFDQAAAVERLAAAVRLKTISDPDDAKLNEGEFLRLHRQLETGFPRTHATLKRETVNDLTLLYTWPGSDPSAHPVLLMAHMDVVPVDEATEKQWTHPGFSGARAEGFVWGRGAWDNKSNLMSQFEAIELLVQAGFKPRRTIHLLAGADEEVNGARGAGAAAALMKQRGVRFEFVLDEGLVITEGIVPGIANPVGLIGVAQKGYMTAGLSVKFAKGGHSSLPPRESVIGVLAAGLARIEQQPFEPAIAGVPEEMFARLAPEMSFPNRLFMSNLWLFRPLVLKILAAGDATRAQLHTTTALTTLKSGVKENVIPAQAHAQVNFRILPGETSDTVLQAVRDKLADPRIEVTKPARVFEPSRVSSSEARGFRAIEKALRQTFPGTIVSPGLFTARADAGYFDTLADNVYLFSPVRVRQANTARFHGIDERIAIANYAEMVRFYHLFIQEAAR